MMNNFQAINIICYDFTNKAFLFLFFFFTESQISIESVTAIIAKSYETIHEREGYSK